MIRTLYKKECIKILKVVYFCPMLPKCILNNTKYAGKYIIIHIIFDGYLEAVMK